jgi:hypothetical protein
MNEPKTELEDLFDRAAALAGRVPASMQGTAFELAVQALGGMNAKAQPRAATGAESRPGSKPRLASGRPGPKAAVESMIDSGYLNDPRLVGDIRDHLGARGWKYVPKEIATAVLRLLREGSLVRSRGGDGQYRYQRAS